jgi:hypothetical protein
MQRSSRAILLLLALGAAPRAGPDGGDSRPATPEEREFAHRALEVLARALPAPPRGFEVRSAGSVAAPVRVPADSERWPMPLSYAVTWVDDRQAAAEKAGQDAALSRAVDAASQPEARARREELQARIKELSAELREALQRNDQARAEEVKRQLEAAGKEMTLASQAPTFAASTGQRSRLGVTLSVNGFEASEPAGGHRPLAPLAGNLHLAYHDAAGHFPDRTTVLVGPWRQGAGKESGRYRAAAAAGPHARAYTVKVVVTGDPRLAEAVLTGVDWRALRRLLE